VHVLVFGGCVTAPRYDKWLNLWAWKSDDEICCMPFRYYLLNCENVTYRIMKALKTIIILQFIVLYIFHLFQQQNRVFLPEYRFILHTFYDHLLTIQGGKDSFRRFLKRSHHLDLSKLSLFTNCMQHKLTYCISRF